MKALVVLVHDMGPYWELVSDAFNGALLFKVILHALTVFDAVFLGQ